MSERIREGLMHICWDGCGFKKSTMLKQETWNKVLKRMVEFKRWLIQRGVEGAANLKLHCSLWPFIFCEEAIDLDTALKLVKNASYDGVKFDGVDIFVADHLDVNADEATVRAYGEKIRAAGLVIGDVVAPVWPFKGGGSAITAEGRVKFIEALTKTCKIVQIFETMGVRSYGRIRIDTATSPAEYRTGDVGNNFEQLVTTYKQASAVAAAHGQEIVAEGELSAAGHHSRTSTKKLFERLHIDGAFNIYFQSDDAHVLTFVAGYNGVEDDCLLPAGVSLKDATAAQLNVAVATLASELGKYVGSHHIAASDGDIMSPTAGHDYTGKHCEPDDPNDKTTFEQSFAWVVEKYTA